VAAKGVFFIEAPWLGFGEGERGGTANFSVRAKTRGGWRGSGARLGGFAALVASARGARAGRGAGRRGKTRPDTRGRVGRAWDSAGAGWSGAAWRWEEGEWGIARADMWVRTNFLWSSESGGALTSTPSHLEALISKSNKIESTGLTKTKCSREWNGSSLARITSLATLLLESLKGITQEMKRGSERALGKLMRLFSSKIGKSRDC
jgi:hypothetical protein